MPPDSETPSPSNTMEEDLRSGQTLVPPEKRQKKIPKTQKPQKQSKEKKEKRAIGEKIIRFALKTMNRPTKLISPRFPRLRDDILKSSMFTSAEVLISLGLLLSLFSIVPAVVGAYLFIQAGLGIFAIAMVAIPPLPFIITIFLPKISAGSRSQALENELPYLVGYITVLAGGGISPFTTLKRVSKADYIFPAAAKEARRILMDIEIFGLDALSALERASRNTPNRMWSDFIGGYVAVLKTGGDAVSYLESKLKELFAHNEQRVRSGSDFIGTMAEAYIITTVVMGISLVILWATQNLLGGVSNGGAGQLGGAAQSIDPTLIVLFSAMFVPVISLIFLVVIGSAQVKEPFTFEKPFYILLACLPIAVVTYFVPFLGLPQYTRLGLGLIAATAPASIVQIRYVRAKTSVESKLSNFLRDISEIRKTGLAPEKTIEQLAGRNYGGLTPYVQNISTQLSWGTPMRVVLQNFSASVKSWVVQAMAFLLLEVVDVGGGSPRMFTNLADFTEKNAQLDKERRSMIRPYIMIPYVGAIMVVATTAMMIYFINPPGLADAGIPALASPALVAQATNVLLLCSFFQAWVMGFVAGKMGEGSTADGFKHATLLVIISIITVYVSALFIGGVQ
ncbi:MAG: type II secretion system F family protein [Thaumarchaeota archaeon]|nr:type II secretion system F family protein [Nitrososphaerota archaeon]